jgi:hypothetical protein
LVSLEGQALQLFVSQKRFRADGLLLLREMQQTYKSTNIPEVIAAKTDEFWSKTQHLSNETIDAYYILFHELLDELQDADERAMRHFIFTLGPEFETIQNNYHIGNLPAEWKTQDLPTLLVPCHDYFNSINPQGITKCDSSQVVYFPQLTVPHLKKG